MPTSPRPLPFLIVLALAVVGVGSCADGRARADTVPVSVTSRTVTAPLAPNFLGLALEYKTVPEWMAQPGQAPNLAFDGLLKNLAPTGHPSVRIGGESTDRSWWPVPGVRTPLGMTYTLDDAWARSARELATGSHVRLMLGVNLEAGSPLIARVEADELVRNVGAGNVQSLAIGNEPDLYHVVDWYKEADGHPLEWFSHTGTSVFARPASWDPAAYVQQFSQFARVMPNLPLAGPETNTLPWLTAFDSLLSPHSRVRTITAHGYGLNQCDTNPSTPAYPSVANLLTPYAADNLEDGLGPSIALAHRDGASLRIDEMGSVTCTGRRGVSNTFASALWGADALFAAARAGVNGVNLHTWPDSSNGLFDFTYSRSAHRWRATIHPLYDGAYLFAQAAPTGSQLLATFAGSQTSLHAWSTRAPDHRVRVLLINDSQTAAAVVPIHPPAGLGTATGTVERLTAPGAAALGGIRLGGRAFATTLTGVPQAPILQTVTPRHGVDTVDVPAASAALVTLTPRG